MKDPQAELTKALYDILIAAGITYNSASVPVYTVVDDNASYPFIYLKPNAVSDEGCKTSYITRNGTTIEVAVGYKKRGSRVQADEIMNQICEAFDDDTTVTMTNFDNCLMRIEAISYREELLETERLLVKQLNLLNILEQK